MITLQLSDPAGVIALDGRRSPVQTTFGPSESRPDLSIELSGDTLHRIMLGELSLTKALGAGVLRVQGPVWKALALKPLFESGQAIYPKILLEQGRPAR